jgi:hypothetical protein
MDEERNRRGDARMVVEGDEIEERGIIIRVKRRGAICARSGCEGAILDMAEKQTE